MSASKDKCSTIGFGRSPNQINAPPAFPCTINVDIAEFVDKLAPLLGHVVDRLHHRHGDALTVCRIIGRQLGLELRGLAVSHGEAVSQGRPCACHIPDPS